MTPMEELREQAAKIADDLGNKLKAKACADPDMQNKALILMQADGAWASAAAIRATPFPAPVALPQAGGENQFRHTAEMVEARVMIERLRQHCRNQRLIDSANDLIGRIDAGLSTPTETPTAAAPDGYEGAFYEIAEIMGFGAIAASPKEVWETVMRPRLIEALRPAPDDGLMGRYRALAVAAQRVLDGGYISEHIEEEKADHKALKDALAALSTATGDEAQQGEG